MIVAFYWLWIRQLMLYSLALSNHESSWDIFSVKIAPYRNVRYRSHQKTTSPRINGRQTNGTCFANILLTNILLYTATSTLLKEKTPLILVFKFLYQYNLFIWLYFFVVLFKLLSSQCNIQMYVYYYYYFVVIVILCVFLFVILFSCWFLLYFSIIHATNYISLFEIMPSTIILPKQSENSI